MTTTHTPVALSAGQPVGILGDPHRFTFVGYDGDEAVLRDLKGRPIRVAAVQVTVGFQRIVHPRKQRVA